MAEPLDDPDEIVARRAAVRRRVVATGLGLAALVVAGCAPVGVDVRGQLPPCAEARKIPVEELSEHTDCSLEGWTLRFPDGRRFEAGAADGAASSTSDEPGLEWGASNWGGDGTVAWRRTDEGTTFWGPQAAVDQEILLWSRDLD